MAKRKKARHAHRSQKGNYLMKKLRAELHGTGTGQYVRKSKRKKRKYEQEEEPRHVSEGHGWLKTKDGSFQQG